MVQNPGGCCQDRGRGGQAGRGVQNDLGRQPQADRVLGRLARPGKPQGAHGVRRQGQPACAEAGGGTSLCGMTGSDSPGAPCSYRSHAPVSHARASPPAVPDRACRPARWLKNGRCLRPEHRRQQPADQRRRERGHELGQPAATIDRTATRAKATVPPDCATSPASNRGAAPAHPAPSHSGTARRQNQPDGHAPVASSAISNVRASSPSAKNTAFRPDAPGEPACTAAPACARKAASVRPAQSSPARLGSTPSDRRRTSNSRGSSPAQRSASSARDCAPCADMLRGSASARWRTATLAMQKGRPGALPPGPPSKASL